MVSPKHKILIRYSVSEAHTKRYGVSEHKHTTVSLNTNMIQCFHAYETQTRYSVSETQSMVSLKHKQLGTASLKHKQGTVSQTRYGVSETHKKVWCLRTQHTTESLKHKQGTV